MTDPRKTVETFWAAAEARDWETFADTLAEDVVCTLPQTRERIRAGSGIYGISFFTGDGSGRISAVTDFWPEAYQPPAGRDHLSERY